MAGETDRVIEREEPAVQPGMTPERRVWLTEVLDRAEARIRLGHMEEAVVQLLSAMRVMVEVES